MDDYRKNKIEDICYANEEIRELSLIYKKQIEKNFELAVENSQLKAEIERLNIKYDFQLLVKENKELKLTLSGRTFSDSDDKIKLDKCVAALKSIESGKIYIDGKKGKTPKTRCREILKEIGVEL